MGKTFHKKKELFSQLFSTLSTSTKIGYYFVHHGSNCYQKYFLQKDMAETMISQIVSCLLQVSPRACDAYVMPCASLSSHVCLIFRVTEKYECPTNLCRVQDMFWEEGKGEKVELG